MVTFIFGAIMVLALWAAFIVVGTIAGERKKNQNRSSGGGKHPFGVPMSDKKVPWTGRRFLGDDDTGRRKR